MLSLALCAWALLGALPGRVRAQPLSLEWKAPASCPDADSVRERAQAMLAKSAAKGQSLRAHGTVLVKNGVHVLTLRLELEAGTVSKKLEASDCEVLGDTAAWLMAVAIDPNVAPPPPRAAAGAGQPASSEKTPESAQAQGDKTSAKNDEAAAKPPPSTQPDEARKPPEPPRPPRKPLPLGVAADLWGGLWVPGLAGPMGSLGGRLSLDVAQLRVGVRYLHHFTRQEHIEGGAHTDYRADELGAIASFFWGHRIKGGPYAALSGQRLQASSHGITQPESVTQRWLGLELGGEARIRIWRFVEGLAQLGAAMPLTARPVFQITGLQGEIGVNFISLSANLGVGISLP